MHLPGFGASAAPCGFRPQEIWYSHTLGQGVHKLSVDLAGYAAEVPCPSWLRRMWIFDYKSLLLTWTPCSIIYLAGQPFLIPNTNSLLILQFPDELGRRYFVETCQDGRSSGMSVKTALVSSRHLGGNAVSMNFQRVLWISVLGLGT